MRVNGEETVLRNSATLLRFLQTQGFDPKAVAVERNGAIVARADFGTTELAADDVLEILRFVGGG